MLKLIVIWGCVKFVFFFFYVMIIFSKVIDDVSVVNKVSEKKMVVKSLLNGICLNVIGSVIKISLGLLVGLSLNVKMMGKIVSFVRIVIKVFVNDMI